MTTSGKPSALYAGSKVTDFLITLDFVIKFVISDLVLLKFPFCIDCFDLL